MESYRGQERREILLDFARTHLTLANNYDLLGVDPERADALILSHGHSDHYGALPDLSKIASAWKERGVRLYVGGEDTFCARWNAVPGGAPTSFGQLSRDELESWGLEVALAKEGSVVA